MSKFTRVQTQFRDLGALWDALEEMGFAGLKYDENGQCRYQSYTGTETGGHIVVPQQNLTFEGRDYSVYYEDIVFTLNEETGEVDILWGIHNDPLLLKAIRRQYALQVVKQAAGKQGMRVAEFELQPDGSYRMLLRANVGDGKTVVTIDNEGTTEAEAKGIKGRACAPVINELKQAIGGTVEAEEKTPEWYEDPPGGEQGVRWGG